MTDDEIAGASSRLLEMMDNVERSEDCAARRRRTRELLAVAGARRVVDVGCGAATALIELALDDRTRSVRGIDINEGMLAVARARAARAGVVAEFSQGSCDALPLADASVDGYLSERMLQHLSEPLVALREARRALVRGGRVVLVELDWDAALIESDDRETTRALVRMFANSSPNGTIGRGLRSLLLDAGFENVCVEPSFALSTDWASHGWFVELLATLARVMEPVPSETVERWIDEQRERAKRGRFCVVMPWFVASATR